MPQIIVKARRVGLRSLGLRWTIATIRQELEVNDQVRERAYQDLQDAVDARIAAQREFNETMERVAGRETALRIKLMKAKEELTCILQNK